MFIKYLLSMAALFASMEDSLSIKTKSLQSVRQNTADTLDAMMNGIRLYTEYSKLCWL